MPRLFVGLRIDQDERCQSLCGHTWRGVQEQHCGLRHPLASSLNVPVGTIIEFFHGTWNGSVSGLDPCFQVTILL